MKQYLLIFLTFFTISCDKESNKNEKLESIEYRFINMGDPNLKGVHISSELMDFQGNPYGGETQSFFDVPVFDTVTMVIENNNADYLNKIRKTKLKIGFKNKVYSPLFALHNIILEGNPYQFGWTDSRSYEPLQMDTIHNFSKKIYYIRWPQDTLLIKEIFW